MEGLDYDHGTGHGVGAGLSVHEGPVSISIGVAFLHPPVMPDSGQLLADAEPLVRLPASPPRATRSAWPARSWRRAAMLC